MLVLWIPLWVSMSGFPLLCASYATNQLNGSSVFRNSCPFQSKRKLYPLSLAHGRRGSPYFRSQLIGIVLFAKTVHHIKKQRRAWGLRRWNYMVNKLIIKYLNTYSTKISIRNRYITEDVAGTSGGICMRNGETLLLLTISRFF